VRGVLENLMYLSGTRNLLYVTNLRGAHSVPGYKLEHLSCFYGGLLALGVETLTGTGDLPLADAELHRWAAEGLTTTCYLAYAETPSGVGPEEIHFLNSKAHMSRPWMPEVRKWMNKGRKGGVPPGVVRGADALPRKALPTGDRPSTDREMLDYWLSSAAYYLRPEVLHLIDYSWYFS
jgi:mannosyl-oligosaccharide alpha-1,2-mannosidase